MPSDANGVYSLPPIYVAITGETITAVQHNSPLEDIQGALTARLMRSGAGAMTGALKFIDGSAAAPAWVFNSAQTTGLYKTATGNIGLSIGGTLVAEFGPAGMVTGFIASTIPDKAITLQKLYHPSAPAVLLGTNSNPALTITGAADNGAGLVRLTVAATTTFATGQKKTVSDVTGTTEANGTWTITVVDATHIDLQGSAFANAYVSGGTIGGGVDEITLGAGLVLQGTTLSAPAFAPPGVFKNLSIKVASNTTVTVAADAVVMTDGTTFLTRPVSSTVNLGTNGGVDALQGALTIATSTWYALWAIAKPDGTTKVLANVSATAVVLPAGYTYAARIGWVRTIAASATLYGTWQLGRRVQYIVGLAQTADLPLVATGANTGAWIAAAVGNFVPPTASIISLTLFGQTNGGGGTQYTKVAPNNSYSVATGAPYAPLWIGGNFTFAEYCTTSADIVLESTNIYMGQTTMTSGALSCRGWEDNI